MRTLKASAAHERHEQQLLTSIEHRHGVTQRRLASELGIALGLTNLLLRRLAKKGWIRVTHVSPRRIRYLITPAGVAAKARLTRQYFLYSLNFYRESRARVRERLATLVSEMASRTDANERIPVVFYGIGEDAEVAYVCLQETLLDLVGVVDPAGSARFFQTPTYQPAQLSGRSLAATRFDRLIVMPLQDADESRAQLDARGVPAECVFWL